MIWPTPPESGFSSFRRTITGATFSVASTGIVRTPDGNAVALRPSLVSRAPEPPELKVMISKSATTALLPRGNTPPER